MTAYTIHSSAPSASFTQAANEPLAGSIAVPAVAGGGGGPYDGRMEHRVTALEIRLDTILPTLATKADIADVRSDIHKGSGDLVKWIVGTGFVGMAAMITIMTFVLNNAVPKAAQPYQQPIIINVPSASAPAASTPR